MITAVKMQVIRLAVLLFLLSSFAAAQCEKPAWIIGDDDGIVGNVSKAGGKTSEARNCKLVIFGPRIQVSDLACSTR
jgi:hypothetical protein